MRSTPPRLQRAQFDQRAYVIWKQSVKSWETVFFTAMKAGFRTFAAGIGPVCLCPSRGALPTAAEISAAFKAIDTSGNGAISRAEWDQASFELFLCGGQERGQLPHTR